MSEVTLVKDYIDPGHFVTEAVLFPDSNNTPALLCAGSGELSIPWLTRSDADGKLEWSAVLPAEVEALVMLEPTGKPRLFVGTLASGSLLILDGHGTLIQELDLPRNSGSGRVSCYGLDAGEIAPGQWAIYVSLLDDSYLYPLNLAEL